MQKRTIVHQIEITQNGIVQVRFQKQIVDDDGEVHDLGFHRTSIEPGTDPDAQLAAVNVHLEAMKCAAVEESEWQRVRAHCTVAQPAEVVSTFRAASAAAEMARAAAAMPAELAAELATPPSNVAG